MSFPSRSKIDAALACLLLLGLPRAAKADEPPSALRLRGDALAQTRSPVGLVMLRGEDRARPWLDVETVTWLGVMGASGDAAFPAGDVLTLSVRARDAASGSEARFGRMVVSMGAIRPVHIDGVRALGRVFGGTTLEAFGGFPVARRFDYRTFDAAAGGRLGQSIGDVAAFGGSYAMRRRAAERDDEEVGLDFALTPSPWLTAVARSSFDIVTPGPADALASISVQNDDMRGELFTTHRSPGRLLPSTSLFSVLGDFAATSTGATFRWRAAPRLELVTTGSVQVQGGEAGGQALGRATLSLDDAWDGAIGVEARRVDFHGARWIGVRASVAIPITAAFRVATELELVRPDEPRGRGSLWPWALGALAWSSPSGWEIATGVEGSWGTHLSAAGAEYRGALHALTRVSYAFGRTTP
ncbi:MAG: hypothetical protein KF819_02435 [Labilithrix sp.]|nr:hypothetical protein [Labilithrix sp.]